MDKEHPWIARALSGAVALAIATGLFAAASIFVSAVMPLVGHLHLQTHRIGLFVVMLSSMTSTGIAMWVVFAGRGRKAPAEPDVVPLPRLPKAG